MTYYTLRLAVILFAVNFFIRLPLFGELFLPLLSTIDTVQANLFLPRGTHYLFYEIICHGMPSFPRHLLEGLEKYFVAVFSRDGTVI